MTAQASDIAFADSARITPRITPRSYSPAHVIASDDEALRVAHQLAKRFATSAAHRDSDRILPHEELNACSAAGLWAMTIPSAYGGAQVSYATVGRVFAILAAADPSIAQIQQNHNSAAFWLWKTGTESQRAFFLGEILRGARFGNANVNAGGRLPTGSAMTIAPDGDGFRLSGTKLYSTGALFADYVSTIGQDAQGRRVVEPRGIRVEWVEFPSGLTLLQALDMGEISLGNSGNVGCIFLQAAGAHIDYIAALPSGPKSEGVLVRADSGIRKIADLRGKKVGYAKGSSSHDLIAAALEKSGVKLSEIKTISLGAADAAFAYEGGNIDAWVIWDPYFTIAQKNTPSRVLAYAGDIDPSSGFLLANSTFAGAHPDLVRAYIDGSKQAGEWAKSHPAEVTAALSAATGIPADVMAAVNQNARFDVTR
jgi:sulfonate transport system substrate-binding protein